VTESINNGDMWSVIYEQFVKTGLPPKLAIFYSASIVMALSHIHSKGMAYRDLKPENIMIDSKGYAKIIDFGFAKMIPYVKDGKVYAKSYTLCGTPEYLAPEFVFNLGHDHSADLWALGIMVFEFHMTTTPFVPKRADNITELFNNIAGTKTNGIKLPLKLDERAKTKAAADLILRLLKPQPSERMGVQEGYTNVILEHEYFRDFELEQLINGTLKPVHIPTPPRSQAPISTLPAIKAFKGDQSQFDFF
jgi:cGMP-dependent protein kinase